MNRLTITAGTGEDRNGAPIPADTLALRLARIREYLAREFGGFTELESIGGWRDEAGRVVLETGRRFIVATDDPFNTGRDAAEFIRRALNQHSVMLERDPAASVAFVGADAVAAEGVAA